VAEHGLAYHLASFRDHQQRQIMLDFGLTGQALFTNLQLLGLDPGQVDALILSHGHGDHYGGLLALAEATPEWSRRDIPLYTGGADTFCRRWTVASDVRPERSERLERSEVEARGPRVVLAREPTLVAEHALVSGQIPRLTDFETGLPNARLEVGLPGFECGDSALGLTGAKPGDLVADSFDGEIATVYAVRDRGLVVISSCGHAGNINTVRHARHITGLTRVHAVIGGWHLADASDAVLASTLAAFEELDPEYFLPMHCTGFSMMARIESALSGRVIEPSSGTRATFGT
jgi:7,8-dihydropterin-6-yl-methyl-4-(beta-D-ribofuranosyl)aminobenzene 5'-phosphate synthase